MTERSPDVEVRAALYELQRYLSDETAPLMAAEAVDVLLSSPATVVASVIQSWVTSQYGRVGAKATVSDYLFHSLKKIHWLAELELLERERVKTYVEELGRLLLEFCPADDRERLWTNLEGLGAIDSAMTAPVEIVHRQVRTAETSPRGGDDAPTWRSVKGGGGSGASTRGFALLMNRLARDSRGEDIATTKTDPGDGRLELLTQVLATAAIQSGNEGELERNLRPLTKMGVNAEMGQVFRALGRSLPEWTLSQDAAAAPSVSARSDRAVGAMRRIITMAGDEREGTKRFGEMVSAAIEQFNAGSLVQAATMFELAEQVVNERKLTPELLKSIRRQGRENLAAEQLRRYAEKPETHARLRTVLNFFPGLTVDGLMSELEDEPKRDRRKLLLALIEAHGPAARQVALERLAVQAKGDADVLGYFRRNLIFLLRRIPAPAGVRVDEELDLLELTSRLTGPVLLVREAISALGQINHDEAEKILTARLTSLEQLLGTGNSGIYETQDVELLLDRTVSALANLGSSSAFRAIVDHALKRRRAQDNSIARLEVLATRDLSEDKALVERLVETLRADLPVKVLGFVVKHDNRLLGSLIRALAGTSAPAVRDVLEEVVQRFPGRDFAAAASKVLSAFGVSSRPVETVAESLSGEVELFGLPNLFQVLAESRLTGILVLANRAGEQVANIAFESGQIRDCASGALKGKAAFYQLFERPVRGTFNFQSQAGSPKDGKPDESLLDVIPMIVEAVRRHDEFREAKILVPGNVQLTATLVPPSPPETDEEPAFVQTVWKKASSGVTPAKLEDALGVDSYRVRHLLAHWVEEGALQPR